MGALFKHVTWYVSQICLTIISQTTLSTLMVDPHKTLEWSQHCSAPQCHGRQLGNLAQSLKPESSNLFLFQIIVELQLFIVE